MPAIAGVLQRGGNAVISPLADALSSARAPEADT